MEAPKSQSKAQNPDPKGPESISTLNVEQSSIVNNDLSLIPGSLPTKFGQWAKQVQT